MNLKNGSSSGVQGIMKQISLLLFVLVLVVLSNSQTTKVAPPAKQLQICGPLVKERIRTYFDREEIRPTQVINNTDDSGAWASKTTAIKIGDHTVEWIDKVEKHESESSLKINGELITLKDKRSVNQADGGRPVDFYVVNKWDQIKLYKLHEADVIGITMRPWTCTGLMCSVAAQLMYDVKTKQKTYFGSFRTDDETRLFGITNQNDYYYVAKNFDGDPHGLTVPQVVTYELYKRDKSGSFVVQTNSAGQRYFIKHITFPDMEFKGDEVMPKKEVSADKLEQNWIKKVD